MIGRAFSVDAPRPWYWRPVSDPTPDYSSGRTYNVPLVVWCYPIGLNYLFLFMCRVLKRLTYMGFMATDEGNTYRWSDFRLSFWRTLGERELSLRRELTKAYQQLAKRPASKSATSRTS